MQLILLARLTGRVAPDSSILPVLTGPKLLRSLERKTNKQNYHEYLCNVPQEYTKQKICTRMDS